jgi:DNA helicase HerA-like ATPase
VRPYILFVFDEAQEFVADLTNSRGIDKECSQAVETLLRQGRKYGLGGCIATQRIAYLNTSALQQLHTYFVGTLVKYQIIQQQSGKYAHRTETLYNLQVARNKIIPNGDGDNNTNTIKKKQ